MSRFSRFSAFDLINRFLIRFCSFLEISGFTTNKSYFCLFCSFLEFFGIWFEKSNTARKFCLFCLFCLFCSFLEILGTPFEKSLTINVKVMNKLSVLLLEYVCKILLFLLMHDRVRLAPHGDSLNSQEESLRMCVWMSAKSIFCLDLFRFFSYNSLKRNKRSLEIVAFRMFDLQQNGKQNHFNP